MISSFAPYIIETGPGSVERTYDIFSRLLKDRIIFFGFKVTPETANTVIAQLLLLDTQSNDPIRMYINSPGGEVYSGLAVVDTMRAVKSPVYTTCVGLAASMGAILLAAGEKGHRSALPHSRVMIHQPLGGVSGQASDMVIEVKEIEKVKKELYQILADTTGKPFSKINKDCDRNSWMRSDEALKYGLIDHIRDTTFVPS